MPDLHPNINGTVSLKRFGGTIVPACERELGKERKKVFFVYSDLLPQGIYHGSPTPVRIVTI